MPVTDVTRCWAGSPAVGTGLPGRCWGARLPPALPSAVSTEAVSRAWKGISHSVYHRLHLPVNICRAWEHEISNSSKMSTRFPVALPQGPSRKVFVGSNPQRGGRTIGKQLPALILQFDGERVCRGRSGWVCLLFPEAPCVGPISMLWFGVCCLFFILFRTSALFHPRGEAAADTPRT